MNNTTDEKVALGEPTIPDFLLLNAKKLGRRLKRHPVNALFGQLHGVEADVAYLVALVLHGNVEPILMLDRVTLALVVAGGVSLFGLFAGGGVESFTQEHTTRSAGGRRNRIAVGQLVGDIGAAGSERSVTQGAGGGAAGEQGDSESAKQSFGYSFHRCDVGFSAGRLA